MFESQINYSLIYFVFLMTIMARSHRGRPRVQPQALRDESSSVGLTNISETELPSTDAQPNEQVLFYLFWIYML